MGKGEVEEAEQPGSGRAGRDSNPGWRFMSPHIERYCTVLDFGVFGFSIRSFGFVRVCSVHRKQGRGWVGLGLCEGGGVSWGVLWVVVGAWGRVWCVGILNNPEIQKQIPKDWYPDNRFGKQ